MRKVISLLLSVMLVVSLAVPAFATSGNLNINDLENGRISFKCTSGNALGYHSTDLFGSQFKNIMPGDTISERITITSSFSLFSEDSMKVWISGIPHSNSNPLRYSEAQEEADGKDETPLEGRDETVASMEDFLSRLTLRVTNTSNGAYDVLYYGPADGIMEKQLLGTFRSDSKLSLRVDLEWELGGDYDYNQYQNRVGEIDWIFHVEAFDDPTVDNPKTGDYIMIAVGVMAVSAAALVILLVIKKRKKS